jgi:hypothetical protein
MRKYITAVAQISKVEFYRPPAYMHNMHARQELEMIKIFMASSRTIDFSTKNEI